MVVLTSQEEVWQALNQNLTDSKEVSHAHGTIYQIGKVNHGDHEWEVGVDPLWWKTGRLQIVNGTN